MSGRAVGAEPVIVVRDVNKHYGLVRAVDGVSFEVARGEVFGLLGPNGAGKTTTVEMLEGLRSPDTGELTVLGIDAARHPDRIKPRIGVQLQTAALYPQRHVWAVTLIAPVCASTWMGSFVSGVLVGPPSTSPLRASKAAPWQGRTRTWHPGRGAAGA